MTNPITKLFLPLLFAISSTGYGQCPTGPVSLLTQSDVSAFPASYPGCTFLPQGVDLNISGNDITDLSPLIQLTGSDAVIEVRDCPLLESLAGFNNIHRIGNDILDGFILRDLPLLSDITALSNLDTLHGEFTIRNCPDLADLSGLNKLSYINGSFIIRENGSLVNLNSLDSLNFIGETLEIVQNIALTDLFALQNIDSIKGGIEGGVFIEGNTQLITLSGLGHGGTYIGSNLDLILNGNLDICSVPSVCNYLANPPAGAVITITSNKTGCNTLSEIQSGCLTVGMENSANENQYFVIESMIISDHLTAISNGNINIRISNSLGQSFIYQLHPGRNEINLSFLNKGIFLVSHPSGKVLKFIKQ